MLRKTIHSDHRANVIYIEEQGGKNGKRGDLRNKLNILCKIVDKARKRGIPGADLEQFDCTNDKFRAADTVPRTVDYWVILALENLDLSQITEPEQFHIDLFFFSASTAAGWHRWMHHRT